MQDRVPLYPGRVTMTPVAGQANTFDMARADDPTQPGTPRNKATFLKDATAALYGLGTGAVPDDVLAAIGRYNQYWWRRRANGSHWEPVIADATFHDVVFANGLYGNGIIQYSDQITFDSSGAPQLSNPTVLGIPLSSNTSYLSVLLGKYFAVTKNNYSSGGSSNPSTTLNAVYYVPPTTSDFAISYTDSTYIVRFSCGAVTGTYVSSTGDWEYVQSSNRNAYPDSGTSGGYEYEYLGIPFDNAVTAPKIETGSYVGTGTYGASNPNTLTFGFAPHLVIMYYADGRYSGNLRPYDDLSVAVVPMDFITTSYLHTNSPTVTGYSADYTYSKKSDDGKTLFWYNTRNAMGQLNNTNDNVFYMAIG